MESLEVSPLVPNNQSRRRRIKYVVAGMASFCVVLLVVIGLVTLAGNTGKSLEVIETIPDAPDFMFTTIPCVYGQDLPKGCDTSRVRKVECNNITIAQYPTVMVNDGSACTKGDNRVSIGQAINIQFYQDPVDKMCLEITLQIGECWGENPINHNLYDCQGQCGPSCVGKCQWPFGGSWSRNCLRHDVCSWYFGSSDGMVNDKCGKSMQQAAPDFLTCSCDISGTYKC